tara:strand:+ start:152 stop:304 length:153 start_codon:yes stop_codon:yes gene_type:complete
MAPGNESKRDGKEQQLVARRAMLLFRRSARKLQPLIRGDGLTARQTDEWP